MIIAENRDKKTKKLVYFLDSVFQEVFVFKWRNVCKSVDVSAKRAVPE